MKPEAYNKISVINTESGTTMDIDLKRFLRFIGNSVLPPYPGFRVIKIAQSAFKGIFYSSSCKCGD
jgi:hypothetical protein